MIAMIWHKRSVLLAWPKLVKCRSGGCLERSGKLATVWSTMTVTVNGTQICLNLSSANIVVPPTKLLVALCRTFRDL